MTSRAIDQAHRFVVSEAVVARELDGEMVLLDLDSGTYFGLDRVGTRMWQILVDGASADDIVDRLFAEYDVPRETLQHDVLRLLEQLRAKGLVMPADGPR
ncbi:MAG TPA: PqqD family protein [Vicinamibacterales bacterium]|jgi:hypothetical protein